MNALYDYLAYCYSFYPTKELVRLFKHNSDEVRKIDWEGLARFSKYEIKTLDIEKFYVYGYIGVLGNNTFKQQLDAILNCPKKSLNYYLEGTDA